MKTFLLCLFFISQLHYSCSKDTNVNDEPKTTVSFNALGTTHTIEGSLAVNSSHGSIIKKVTLENNLPGYQLEVENGSTLGLILQLAESTSLQIKTYNVTFTSPNSPRYGEIHGIGTVHQYVAGYNIGDYVTITINKIENGFASGTFSAMLSAWNSQTNRIEISNGVFNNVKILN